MCEMCRTRRVVPAEVTQERSVVEAQAPGGQRESLRPRARRRGSSSTSFEVAVVPRPRPPYTGPNRLVELCDKTTARVLSYLSFMESGGSARSCSQMSEANRGKCLRDLRESSPYGFTPGPVSVARSRGATAH